jgi:hypothetical protein
MGGQSDPLSSTLINDRLLSLWLVTASSQIEKYLDREIEIKSRVEFFDIIPGKKRFYISSFPILSLAVSEDMSGVWDGSNESTIDDCFSSGASVNLPFSFDYSGIKALRITYTGGLAYHAVNSEFILSTSQTGTWAAGGYVYGSSSGAIGITVGYTSATKVLVVESYYGVFCAGEAISQYVLETRAGSASATGTIASISKASLSESHPAIVMSCDILARYFWKHTTDFENTASSKDGTSIRKYSQPTVPWPLTEEVRGLLSSYINTRIL